MNVFFFFNFIHDLGIIVFTSGCYKGNKTTLTYIQSLFFCFRLKILFHFIHLSKCDVIYFIFYIFVIAIGEGGWKCVICKQLDFIHNLFFTSVCKRKGWQISVYWLIVYNVVDDGWYVFSWCWFLLFLICKLELIFTL